MQFDYVLMFGVVRSVYTASYGHLGSLLRGPYIRATFGTLSRVLIVRVVRYVLQKINRFVLKLRSS